MKIIHIDTGKEWRGGQRQALFLHQGLMSSGIDSLLVCNAEGELAKKDVQGLYPMEFRGEADTSFAKHLKKLIKSLKPDIVHTHDAHALTPALIVKASGQRFRLINTRRVDFSVNKGFFSRLKYTNRYVDRVVAISDAIRNILISDGVSSEKIPVINSGVQFPDRIDYTKVLSLKEKYCITPDTFLIGNIANISDHKDHRTLLDAFDIFCRQADDAKLMIVGNGPLEDEVRAYAATLPCAGSVIFTGYISDIYEHIALFDIFCMSSKKEGLCTSIIDAFFMGRPVAATKAGGIPELVKHRFNGILSDVGDAESLAESMLKLYDDVPSAEKYSANAFHTSLKFTDSAMVYKYIKLYGELMRS